MRVVKALKANGHVVAMTGDGVNDAAALRNADIGVAMGITGTEVTKEAGDMVLADDNFATIVGAVEQGRTIYDNIVKFVRFQLSTSMGAIGTIMAASLAGLPVPFTAIQVLWVNIIADGPPAMTLGVDPPSPDVMDRTPAPAGPADPHPRPPRAPCLFGAAVMAAGTLGLTSTPRAQWGQDVALSMTFTTFVLLQMANVLNARSAHTTVFSRYTFSNGKLWAAIGVVAVLQVLAVRWGPMQRLFDTETLGIEQLAWCFAVAVAIIPAEEIRKLVAKLVRRGAEPPATTSTGWSRPRSAGGSGTVTVPTREAPVSDRRGRRRWWTADRGGPGARAGGSPPPSARPARWSRTTRSPASPSRATTVRSPTDVVVVAPGRVQMSCVGLTGYPLGSSCSMHASTASDASMISCWGGVGTEVVERGHAGEHVLAGAGKRRDRPAGDAIVVVREEAAAGVRHGGAVGSAVDGGARGGREAGAARIGRVGRVDPLEVVERARPEERVHRLEPRIDVVALDAAERGEERVRQRPDRADVPAAVVLHDGDGGHRREVGVEQRRVEAAGEVGGVDLLTVDGHGRPPVGAHLDALGDRLQLGVVGGIEPTIGLGAAAGGVEAGNVEVAEGAADVGSGELDRGMQVPS